MTEREVWGPVLVLPLVCTLRVRVRGLTWVEQGRDVGLMWALSPARRLAAYGSGAVHGSGPMRGVEEPSGFAQRAVGLATCRIWPRGSRWRVRGRSGG